MIWSRPLMRTLAPMRTQGYSKSTCTSLSAAGQSPASPCAAIHPGRRVQSHALTSAASRSSVHGALRQGPGPGHWMDGSVGRTRVSSAVKMRSTRSAAAIV
jgi:hypothetical protein